MSSARISNSKDIYIYIYDIRRDEKRVENLVGGNVATKARFLVHEINHTRVRVMDERRKRGNTSGSLKRSWSQQGWREREGGRADRRTTTLWEISVLRSAEKSTVAFGWREKLPRRFRGIHEGPIVLFKTFDHASPFFIEYSFVRSFMPHCLPHPAPTYPGEQKRVSSVRRSTPVGRKETRGAGEKGVGSTTIELFIQVSLKGREVAQNWWSIAS